MSTTGQSMHSPDAGWDVDELEESPSLVMNDDDHPTMLFQDTTVGETLVPSPVLLPPNPGGSAIRTDKSNGKQELSEKERKNRRRLSNRKAAKATEDNRRRLLAELPSKITMLEAEKQSLARVNSDMRTRVDDLKHQLNWALNSLEGSSHHGMHSTGQDFRRTKQDGLEQLQHQQSASRDLVDGVTNLGRCSKVDETEKEKKRRHIMANRRSAKASRDRKRRLLKELPFTVEDLETERRSLLDVNSKLRSEVQCLRYQLQSALAAALPAGRRENEQHGIQQQAGPSRYQHSLTGLLLSAGVGNSDGSNRDSGRSRRSDVDLAENTTCSL